MQFIDTHTHIYSEEFDNDRAEVVERAIKAGAQMLLLPNIDEASIDAMMQLCQRYPTRCRPMMGLHPTELPADPAPLLCRMEQMLSQPSFCGCGRGGRRPILEPNSTRRTN